MIDAAAPELDVTHDRQVSSWVESANGHTDFGIQNLPLGIFSSGSDPQSSGPRGGIRIGDMIVDLSSLAGSGLLSGPAWAGAHAAAGPTLNAFFAAGSGPRRALRARVHELLTAGAAETASMEAHLVPADEVTMHLPATIGDYTDFYVGIHHAMTVGSLFRPDQPLMPNYKWVPIGYHGRASSIRISGQPFRRPRGQRKNPSEPAPSYEPARNLDFELELGVWVGEGNAAGEPIRIDRAADQVAGYCLLNDWSARDVQSFEYQPLGPFLSKNFATTVSAWVVTPEALLPFRAPAFARPPGDPAPLPHLSHRRDQDTGGLDVELEVLLSSEEMRRRALPALQLARSSTRHMYWTVAQMITHHTSGGCDLRAGDLLGTGTISGPDIDSCGSLLELTANGRQAISLPSGETRTFLQDGDEVILRARAHRPDAAPVGFGECRAIVLPALGAQG